MKRALLFTGGVIGGLGAVVVLAPPDLTIAPPSVEPTIKPVAAETFTGDPITMRYGIVQVKITVQGGKIIDAQAVKVPTGSNDRYTQMSVPVLRERTIAAQSANIQAVSGASFTSYGWYTSLASAIAKAGL
jgi:uncharacterized protein with FMN-binding domain